MTRYGRRMEQKAPCLTHQQLIADVQDHLMQTSKLTAVAEALENGNENFVDELNKQLDVEFGKKERAMGALQQLPQGARLRLTQGSRLVMSTEDDRKADFNSTTVQTCGNRQPERYQCGLERSHR